MRPDVQPFRHESTGTWSYVVVGPGVAALRRSSTRCSTSIPSPGAAPRRARAPIADFVARAGPDQRVDPRDPRPRGPPERRAVAAGRDRREDRDRAGDPRGAEDVPRHPEPRAGVPGGRPAVRPPARGRRVARARLAVRARDRDAGPHQRQPELPRRRRACSSATRSSCRTAARRAATFRAGTPRLLYASIRRLYELPGETRVFVCHDYKPGGREARCETTIAAEREANIHLKDGTSEAEFTAMRRQARRDARDAGAAVSRPCSSTSAAAGRRRRSRTGAAT